MDNCILSGNLGNDPEIFYSENGSNPVASFNLAFKSGKKTGWIKVASFQKLAEIVEQHLKKTVLSYQAVLIRNNGRVKEQSVPRSSSLR
ncbi:MAG: single-stranded DNA-binding protein [Proteobacteria bacterium]|nr:single-stranded DNA-binding protein [Pseudomonadota bacterium]